VFSIAAVLARIDHVLSSNDLRQFCIVFETSTVKVGHGSMARPSLNAADGKKLVRFTKQRNHCCS